MFLIADTVTSRIFTVKKHDVAVSSVGTVAYLSVPGLVMSRSCGQSPARDGPDNFQAAFPGRADHRAERRRPLPRTDVGWSTIESKKLWPGSSIRLLVANRRVLTARSGYLLSPSTVTASTKKHDSCSSSAVALHSRQPPGGVRTSAPRMALKVHGSCKDPVNSSSAIRSPTCLLAASPCCSVRDLTHTERGFASKRQVDSPAPSAAGTWLARTLHLCSSRWIIISHLRCSS